MLFSRTDELLPGIHANLPFAGPAGVLAYKLQMSFGGLGNSSLKAIVVGCLAVRADV